MTEMIDHIVMPDQSVLEIHDHDRGKPYGIATLDENGALEQEFSGYADEYPSPIANTNLIEYLVDYIGEELSGA